MEGQGGLYRQGDPGQRLKEKRREGSQERGAEGKIWRMELRTWVTISYDDPKIKPDLLWGCHQADERDTWGPEGCSLWMMMEMMAQGEPGRRQQGQTRISQPGPSGWWLHRGHPVLDPEA